MTQYLRPDDVLAATYWTGDETDVNEVTPNDSDYLLGSSSQNGTIDLSLGSASDPYSSSNHTLKYRIWQQDNPNTRGIEVYLRQGTTTIASWTDTALDRGTPEQKEHTLTSGQADSITDYTDLNVRYVATGETGIPPGNRSDIYVSWIEFSVPDAPAGASSSTDAYTKGKDTHAGSKSAYLQGSTDTQNSQDAYLEGTSGDAVRITWARLAIPETYGTEASSSKGAFTCGSGDASNNAKAYTHGLQSDTSGASAYTQGSDSASSSASACTRGSTDDSDSIDAYLSGSNIATDSTDAYLRGSQDDTDSQDAYTRGSLDDTSSQDAYLCGSQDSSASASAFTRGAQDGLSSIHAYTFSAQGATSSIDAYTRGASEADDSIPAYVRGAQDASDSVSAYTAGSSVATDAASAYLRGSQDDTSSQDAYLDGIAGATSSAHAYTLGYGGVIDSRHVYTRGVDTISDFGTAYLVGSQDATGSQNAYTRGSQDEASALSAYLCGTIHAASSADAYVAGKQDATSSTDAYLIGGIVSTGSHSAYIEGGAAAVVSSSVSAYLAGYTYEELVPDGDISGGSWKNELEGSTLYPSIDEYPPDDDDYAYYDGASGTETFTVSLSNPSGDPTVDNCHVVMWRSGQLVGGYSVTMKMELLQGAAVIASDQQAITTSFQTFIYKLTQGEVESITDYTDLRIRFTVVAVT